MTINVGDDKLVVMTIKLMMMMVMMTMMLVMMMKLTVQMRMRMTMPATLHNLPLLMIPPPLMLL